jgi:hypothetical protein
MSVDFISPIRCVLEHVALFVHDRLVPRERKGALMTVDPNDFVAIVANEVNLRPDKAQRTV